ncbi:MAG: hypothetical protein AAF268_01460 [Cyanobacteria bacterium P01_A01_bin.3]
MLRGLSRLIPEDVRDSLNANPTFQWIVVVLLVFVGATTAATGIKGIRNKRIRGKYGSVIEGTTAQVLGMTYTLLGIIMAGVAISVKFSG